MKIIISKIGTVTENRVHTKKKQHKRKKCVKKKIMCNIIESIQLHSKWIKKKKRKVKYKYEKILKRTLFHFDFDFSNITTRKTCFFNMILLGFNTLSLYTKSKKKNPPWKFQNMERKLCDGKKNPKKNETWNVLLLCDP